MLNEDQLNLLADIFQDRFSEVNARIIRDIGETLKKTGDLTPSQAKKLQQMYNYGADLDLITNQLESASEKSIADIESLYKTVAQEENNWSKPFYDAKGIKQIPLKENKALQKIIGSAATTTRNTLINLSSTTAIGVNTPKGFEEFGTFYKKTIDKAITAVATGVEDYNSVIRQAVRDLGSSGLRVRYESGYTKRLDSAIRQNVLDGVSYVAQETVKQNGNEFGADGVEISAHSPCAPDHLPYQGKQYRDKEYAELQQRLKRPIGEWNCRHFAYPIIIGISQPANSKVELAEMQEYSNEKIEIDGQKYTRYECTQMQRQLETKMRYIGDEKVLYQTVGDDELIRGANVKIRALKNKYVEISQKAGLPTKVERTRIIADKLRNKVAYSGENAIIKLAKGHNIRGEVSVNYEKFDVSKFAFDDAHINKERLHNVTREEAEQFIKESKVLMTRWKGESLCYMGPVGMTYVNLKDKIIKTSFRRVEYDPETLKFIEGVEKLL